MNLFLIGYRCSGKTSIGKVLADRMEWSFIDTDDWVTAASGCSIKEIVTTSGWPVFRYWEQRALIDIIQKDRQVVATGGGIVLEKRNITLMKKSGKIIWLTARSETIRSRMMADPATDAFRPALTSQGAAEEIDLELAQRTPLYTWAADLSISTDMRSAAATAGEILAYLIRNREPIHPVEPENLCGVINDEIVKTQN